MGKSTQTEDESEYIHRIYQEYYVRSDYTDDVGGRGEMIKMKKCEGNFSLVTLRIFFSIFNHVT